MKEYTLLSLLSSNLCFYILPYIAICETFFTRICEKFYHKICAKNCYLKLTVSEVSTLKVFSKKLIHNLTVLNIPLRCKKILRPGFVLIEFFHLILGTNELLYQICSQCTLSLPPENIRKP